MSDTQKNLVNLSWARRKAAEAFSAGLRAGDLLTMEEADEIKEFRQFLSEALSQKGLQLEEEPDGYRVVRAPFTLEMTPHMRLSAAGA
jgi:hypothetical protein